MHRVRPRSRFAGFSLGPGHHPHVELSPDGETLLLASLRHPRNVACRLFALRDRRDFTSFVGATTDMRWPGFLGAWSPDSRRFAATVRLRRQLSPEEMRRGWPPLPAIGAARPGAFVVFDSDTRRRHEVDLGDRSVGLNGVAFSPDGATICVSRSVPAEAIGELLFVDAVTLRLMETVACNDDPPEAVVYAPDGLLATIGRRGSLDQRTARGLVVRTIPMARNETRTAFFDRRGNWLVVRSGEVLRLHTLDPLFRLRQSLRRDWLPGERAQYGLDDR